MTETTQRLESSVRGKRGRSGFSLLEIMIVVAFIAMLAVIAMPSFFRARSRAQMNMCLNNLRMINSAKEMWAFENGKSGMDVVALVDLEPYSKKGIPSCPAGGTYTTTFVDDDPTCTTPGHVLPL